MESVRYPPQSCQTGLSGHENIANLLLCGTRINGKVNFQSLVLWNKTLHLLGFMIMCDCPGLLSSFNSIEKRKDLIDDLGQCHESFRSAVKFDQLYLNQKNGALSDDLYELANYVDKLFMFMTLKVNSL